MFYDTSSLLRIGLHVYSTVSHDTGTEIIYLISNQQNMPCVNNAKFFHCWAVRLESASLMLVVNLPRSYDFLGIYKIQEAFYQECFSGIV